MESYANRYSATLYIRRTFLSAPARGEAIEEVGDRYAIVGFSGMRRSRCKLYRVKGLDENYTDVVRKKIGSIGPMEYPRMAPAIRHINQEFQKVDAKLRLLIILSDGKPEDYDGYNGAYAIEDTRKALLEAKGAGLTPFCITIDKEAHGYLEHMCGRGNYTYINSVESLPSRMPTIYRLLTSQQVFAIIMLCCKG